MKNRTQALLFALLLLVTVGFLYRNTERYQDELPRNERITNVVKNRNITQADLDAMKEIILR
jgi:hypothetical protein